MNHFRLIAIAGIITMIAPLGAQTQINTPSVTISITGAPGSGSGIIWRGTWASATAYGANDAVAWNGSAYIATVASMGAQPDTNPSSWGVLAQAGAAGAPGPPGPGTLIKICEVALGDPSAASSVLQNDDAVPFVCGNKYGSTFTITSIECASKTGTPTVQPVITGGAANSLLTAALSCGTGTFSAGTLNGAPTIPANGSIDVNIANAGGVSKYLVVRITGTL